MALRLPDGLEQVCKEVQLQYFPKQGYQKTTQVKIPWLIDTIEFQKQLSDPVEKKEEMYTLSLSKALQLLLTYLV